MTHAGSTSRRLAAVALAAAAGVLSAVPAVTAKARIPEDPDGTLAGPPRGPGTVKQSPATATRELVTVIDGRTGALLYRFKVGNRYGIPFE